MGAYEAWREVRQRDAEAKLIQIAQDVMGLASGYSREGLKKRWRLLARFAHPDRNLRADAKQTFALFSLCRDVLQGKLDRPVPAGCFRSLIRRLRQAPWGTRSDLPFTGVFKDTNQKRTRGVDDRRNSVFSGAASSSDPHRP